MARLKHLRYMGLKSDEGFLMEDAGESQVGRGYFPGQRLGRAASRRWPGRWDRSRGWSLSRCRFTRDLFIEARNRDSMQSWKHAPTYTA